MRHHAHSILPRPTPALLASILTLVGATALTARDACAQLAVHPSLDHSIAPNMQKIALGQWGEDVVRNTFRARGFEVVNGTVGPHGLDQIAFRRGELGELLEVYAVEVKTRTAAGDLGLPGDSRHGLQLTEQKLAADLELAATNHADPKVRGLVREIQELGARNPAAVKVERHVLTVNDGRYRIYQGPTTTRTVGRPVADGSLDKLFARLGKSNDPATAASARLNRAFLEARRTAVIPAPSALAQAIDSGGAARTATSLRTPPGRASVDAAKAVARLRQAPSGFRVLAPGSGAALNSVTAGLATAGIVAGMAAYDWCQGSINDHRLYEELVRAGGDGAVVGLTTGALLLLTPGAPGVVVIAVVAAVGFVADAAFDWAFERENEHHIEHELRTRYGFIPESDDDLVRRPIPRI